METQKTALVSGFARDFATSAPLKYAKLIILETDELLSTNEKGQFGPILWIVGKPITFVLEKEGYRTTQTATMRVPEEGLNTLQNNVTFQVPSNAVFNLFRLAMGMKEDPSKCQVVTTITARNKTMDDIPHGEENITTVLFNEHHQKVDIKPYYLAIFENWLWPLTDKTNPFDRNLTSTSRDGGVVFANLLPGKYSLTGKKDGMTFTAAEFIARPGIFINISPPQGPMALQESKSEGHANHSQYGRFFKPALAMGFGLTGLAAFGAALAVVSGVAVYALPTLVESLSECCKTRPAKR